MSLLPTRGGGSWHKHAFLAILAPSPSDGIAQDQITCSRQPRRRPGRVLTSIRMSWQNRGKNRFAPMPGRRRCLARSVRNIAAMLALLIAAAATAIPPATAPGAPLFAGMRPYHPSAGTSSALAQRYFEQGMTLAWGFNPTEAARSFAAAAAVDPHCAACFWALAWVEGAQHQYGHGSGDCDRGRGGIAARAGACRGCAHALSRVDRRARRPPSGPFGTRRRGGLRRQDARARANAIRVTPKSPRWRPRRNSTCIPTTGGRPTAPPSRGRVRRPTYLRAHCAWPPTIQGPTTTGST